jgi:sec-independent protein translocase protein TatA
MFGLGIWELVVILVIVVVLFGPKRIKTLGADLGTAIKGFRKAVKEEEPEPAPAEARVIEGQVERKTNAGSAQKQDSNV